MIALFAAISALTLGTSIEVRHAFMSPSADTIMEGDSMVGPLFFNGHTVPTDSQFTRMQDTACIVWGRTGGISSTWRCRGRGNAAVTENTGQPYFEPSSMIIGWVDDTHNSTMWANNPDQSYLGRTICGSPYLSPGECDVWLNSNSGILWGTFVNSDINGGALQWDNSGFNSRPGTYDISEGNQPTADVYRNLLHETGHVLGLDHAFIKGTSTDCPPEDYDCPIMSTNQSLQVAYYPQIDEIQSIRARTSENELRQVQYSKWELNTTGTLVQTKAWTNIAIGTVSPTSVVRVSCRPDAGANWPFGDSNSCILATHNPGELPKFYPVSTGFNSAAIGAPMGAPANFADFGVDIAYSRVGGVNRFLAVGKRPATVASSTRLVFYTGAVGSGTATSIVTTEVQNMSSHTEPRVSFHEPAGVFMVAWPATTGQVMVATVSPTGSLISTAKIRNATLFQTVSSAWPVEVSCDDHLIGNASSCKVFVHGYGADSTDLSFRPKIFSIPVNSTTGAIVSTGGIVTATPAISSDAASLFGDAVGYGNNFIAGEQWGQASYVLVQDRFRVFGSNTVSVLIDRGGDFNPPDVTATNMSMGSGVDAMQTNMTAWDWDETSAQFIAFRTGARQ